ncbi:MAG: hypothetical protein KJ621_10425 [Proteobacteria bacterium]|nr:hypothetical protein [Pseudomonadota bacterium]
MPVLVLERKTPRKVSHGQLVVVGKSVLRVCRHYALGRPGLVFFQRLTEPEISAVMKANLHWRMGRSQALVNQH